MSGITIADRIESRSTGALGVVVDARGHGEAERLLVAWDDGSKGWLQPLYIRKVKKPQQEN